MKKIDKKYLYIVAGIFGVIVLVIAILAIVKACSGPGSDYEKVERQMLKAAERYFNSEDQKLPEEFENKTVTTSELITAEFLKPMEKLIADATCNGKVTVYNYSGQYLYIPDLVCSEYKTNHFVDQVKKDSLIQEEPEDVPSDEVEDETSNLQSNVAVSNVNSDNNQVVVDPDASNSNQQDLGKDYTSGLYQMGDRYVFRGENPKNYVSFGGFLWRIIDINNEGIMRVIKTESENRQAAWDMKFNSEVGKNWGINDYKNSDILKELNSKYKAFKDTTKLHLASYDVCVGKRGANELEVDDTIDCSVKLENQYIGLINAADYAIASLDEHCTSITNGACTNYNFFTNATIQTWTSTGLKENTYEAVNINGGVASRLNARERTYYNWVIAFNANEKFLSGEGTMENPYIVAEVSE